MTDTQTIAGDTLIRDLGSKLRGLVDVALTRPEIATALAAQHINSQTLALEAARKTEVLLQSVNPEIAHVRETRAALDLHNGQTVEGPNLRSIRRSLRSLLGALLVLIGYCAAVVPITRRILIEHPHSQRPELVAILVGFIVLYGFWYFLARAITHLTASIESSSEVFGAGLAIAFCLLPATLAIIISMLLWHRISRASGVGISVLISFGIVLIGSISSAMVAIWIFRTRQFYLGSQVRRGIMRQFGASALWPDNFTVLRETVPEALRFLRHYPQYIRAVKRIADAATPSGGGSASTWYGHGQRLESAVREAESNWAQAVTEKGIVPFLRNLINEMSDPPYSSILKIYDAPGLSQLNAHEYVVSTPSFQRQPKMVGRLSSGLIGLAGPRGVGKTTILEAYRTGVFLSPGQEQIVVYENVPIAYDARDFILRLYFQLCLNVVEFIDRHSKLSVGQARTRSARQRRQRARLFMSVLLWASTLTYIALVIQNPHMRLPIWIWRSAPYFGLAIALSVVLFVWSRSENVDAVLHSAEEVAVTDLATLRQSAVRRMNEIRFQQSRTYGWAGKLTPLGSGELSRSHELAMSAKSYTYPEIVGEFQRFLADTVATVRPVRNLARIPILIILDELDKISSLQDAREFISEAKGFVGTQGSGVLCLMSVSEDALVAFEQRGLPVRDSLDSAFDTVVRVGYLSLSDSVNLLNRRVIGMSRPFICLCHCLAGGLPRELIRVAREIVDSSSAMLTSVGREVVNRDLRDKIYSWRSLVVNCPSDKKRKSDLIWHLNVHVSDESGGEDLIDAVRCPPIQSVGTVANRKSLATLLSIQESILVYLYFCATILEVFDDRLTESQVVEASKVGGPGSFDALASVSAVVLYEFPCRLADSKRF